MKPEFNVMLSYLEQVVRPMSKKVKKAVTDHHQH